MTPPENLSQIPLTMTDRGGLNAVQWALEHRVQSDEQKRLLRYLGTENPYASIPLPATPEFNTRQEMKRIYSDLNLTETPWFHETLWNVLSTETVTGQAISEGWDAMFGPSYNVDPNFRVTPELLEKYASDLIEEQQERMGSSESFLEFIHNVNDVRAKNKQRSRYFSGS